ncbi:MAG: FixH family protein [Myxococcota bacterium]
MNLLLGIALTSLMSLGACSSREAEPTVQGNPASVRTAAGAYTLELPPPSKRFSSQGEVDLEFGVSGPSGAVTGAQVSLEPWMPEMGHGIWNPPVITEIGDGRYRAKWTFSMSGDWELRFEIQGVEGKGTAVVEVEVE